MNRVSLLLVAVLCAATPAAARLTYYSDYFSFAGRDDRGRVAFALDTNRGQDGDAFQAEHFVVLHDEHAGWRPLQGSGAYPNEGGVLEGLPDSADFRFEGKPEAGITIRSGTNGLVLEVEPIPIALERRDGSRHLRMGSAAGVLEWQGRRLLGRVIYEYVQYEGWNRLTRTYFGRWRDFHGFYLALEDPGTGAWSDFYLHSQRARSGAAEGREMEGFAAVDGASVELGAGEIRVEEFGPALGFYFWPLAWKGVAAVEGGSGEFSFDLALRDRKTFGNWVIGGFSMGILTGEVRRGGRAWAAYGLGELIK